MRHRWVVLLIIFIFLLAAFAFRYNVEATKSVNEGVIKWEKDRWTGNVWVHCYLVTGKYTGKVTILSPAFDTDKPEYKEAYDKATRKRNLLTYGWFFSIGITIVWLAYELKRKFAKT